MKKIIQFLFIVVFTFVVIFAFNVFPLKSQINQKLEEKELQENTNAQQDKTATPTKKPRVNQIIKNGEGCEFYICFMINFMEYSPGQAPVHPLDLQLFLTSDYDTKVKIEFKKGEYIEEINIKSGQIIAVRMDKFAQSTIFEMEDVDQSIHIVSEKPISVYGLNRRRQTTDSFLAFPVEVLGDEYMILSYYSFFTEAQSTCSIVATQDSTVVEITPSVQTSQGRPAGKTFTVTLNKGSVYQIGGKIGDDNNKRGDLTGTHIKANKKIAVFGGHQCAHIPTSNVSACNVLVEQLPPMNTWGKHFYIGAFKSRSFYTYRVLASQDSTKVFEDTSLVRILNRGEFYQRDTRRTIQITADKPVLVAQYSQGSGNGDNVGDPMMLLISPTQQYLKKYRFATPINGEWLHFVNVFVPTKAISTFRINGKPVEPTIFERFGTSKYSIASIRLPYSSHTVECSQPFGLYSYGFGIQQGDDAYDAYGTMGGQSFVELEPVPDTIPPFAESVVQNRKKMIIVSDDGRDDTGLRDVSLVKQNNMTVLVPNVSKGAPSIVVAYQPINPAASGSFVIRAVDMASNEIFYSICYVFDQTINEFVTVVNKGDNVECSSTSTYVLGAFLSQSYNFYNANFNKTDKAESSTNFSGLSGKGGLFGFSISRYVFSAFNATAKLNLITNSQTMFSSFDTIKSFVIDDISGNLVPYFRGKEIELKNFGFDIDLGLDWKLSEYFYLSGGLALNLNITKSADVSDIIILPPGYEYLSGGTRTEISNKLNSLRTLNLGAYIGPGAVCSIGNGFQVFIDLNYCIYPFSILSDANLFKSQVNFRVGVKYQLKSK